MQTVLTIAGSDCSGGAGIQADIKTITTHKLYASSAITALTAQNTQGVQAIYDVPAKFVGQQLDSVFTDIRPDAVKIGMVSNVSILNIIAAKLVEYGAQNIVVDPVMVSTSQSQLIATEAASALVEVLFPLASLITPNIAEAQVIGNCEIKDEFDQQTTALSIAHETGVAVLLKGGHLAPSADHESVDWLCANGKLERLSAPWVNTTNTHGTGCTLSSAIACNLATGDDLLTAVRSAKDYVAGALQAGLDLGRGSGPLNHMWNI